MFFTAAVLAVTKKYPSKIYKVIPPIIIIYIGTMAMYTMGVWEMNESVSTARSGFVNNFVPVMIFLMCLRCDLRKIVKLGPRLILTFFAGTFSIALGFILSFMIFRGFFESDTHLAFAAMSAGWMGGTQNFLAVKSALGVSDESMTYTLLMANINYSLLIVILVGIGGFKDKFNAWTKTNVGPIEEICSKIGKEDENNGKTTYLDLMLVLGFAMVVSSISLYMILTMTAANVDLAALVDAPVYIVAGAVILLIHFAIMILLAKLFRLDLYTCGIASIANVGGTSSAPIIAATYDENLVSVSVLMALLGDLAGTFVALGVAQILIAIVG